MKKIKLAGIIIVIGLLLTACGAPEKIGYFEYASYDDYASSAGELSDTGSIYIKGKLVSTEVRELNDVPYLIATVKESKDKNWIVRIGQAGKYTDENLTKYVGKTIYCCGEYVEKIDGCPVLELSLNEKYCIKRDPSADNVINEDSLKASESYLTKWCDANLEDSIFEEIKDAKEPGTYKSTGLVENVKLSNNRYNLYLYQKNNDSFIKTYVQNIGASNTGLMDFSDVANYEDGTGVTLYYTVNERGNIDILGIKKAKVDFTLDDAIDGTGDEIVLKEEYKWGDNGKVNLCLTRNRADESFFISYSGEADTLEETAYSVVYFASIFKQLDMDYYAFCTHNNSEACYMMGGGPDSMEIISGADEDGTMHLSTPAWVYDVSEDEEIVGNIISELKEFYTDFVYKAY